LSEGDVRLPKLFRQTVPQRWPGGGKTAVTELVAWSLDQARPIVSRPQRTCYIVSWNPFSVQILFNTIRPTFSRPFSWYLVAYIVTARNSNWKPQTWT